MIAGQFVAVATEIGGPGVRVANLRSRRVRTFHYAGSPQIIEQVVVKKTGSAAWVLSDTPGSKSGTSPGKVYMYEAGSNNTSVVFTGVVDVLSLAASGLRLYWSSEGAPMSAYFI